MKIEELLEKYLAGETSPDEERVLKEYFTGSDIPVEVEQFKHLFKFYSGEANDTVSTGFEEKLLANLNETKIIKLQHGKYNKIIRYSAIAASILLIFGLSYYYFIFDNHQVIKPKQAIVTDNQTQKSNLPILQDEHALKTKINRGNSTEAAVKHNNSNYTAKHKIKLTSQEKFAFSKARKALDVALTELGKTEKQMNKMKPLEKADKEINKHKGIDNAINKVKNIIGG